MPYKLHNFLEGDVVNQKDLNEMEKELVFLDKCILKLEQGLDITEDVANSDW